MAENGIEEPTKQNRMSGVITLVVTLVLLVVLLVVISREMEEVKEFIVGSGWIGLLASILLYGLLGASPIPSEPLTILISTIFGPLVATFIAGTGNLLAALVEYFIGHRVGNVASFVKQKEKLPFGLGKLPVNSWPFLIAARMIPGYGSKFVSVMGGLYRVPLLRYIWTAAIPIYIGSAIFAYGGFGLIGLGKSILGK